jgi:hypothetical protein
VLSQLLGRRYNLIAFRADNNGLSGMRTNDLDAEAGDRRVVLFAPIHETRR